MLAPSRRVSQVAQHVDDVWEFTLVCGHMVTYEGFPGDYTVEGAWLCPDDVPCPMCPLVPMRRTRAYLDGEPITELRIL